MSLLEIMNSPWAIQAGKFDEIRAIYQTHLKGEKIDIKALESRIGPLPGTDQGYEVVNGNAIIPIDGPIAQKMNLMSKVSGGASTQLIERDIKDAINDASVERIVLKVNSPGGTVAGTAELASFIYESRSEKPIITFSDGVMASAAYWIGSASSEMYISSETVGVGDIGVVISVENTAKAEEESGYKIIEIAAGKYKRIYSQHSEPTEEGLSYLESLGAKHYETFVSDVAKHRGVSFESALNGMADGRLFIGSQAVDAGLVDGIMTFDELVGNNSTIDIEIDSEMLGAGSLNESIAEAVSSAVENTEAGESLTSNEEEVDMEITMETLLAESPEIAEVLRAEGRESAMKEIDAVKQEAIKEGAEGERARILAVKDQMIPGHEELVEALMFDGVTTGAEAAVKVVQAAKATAATFAESLVADEIKPLEDPKDESSASNLPLEEQCKANWNQDAKLRAEFGSYDAYFHFQKAFDSGQARILTK